MTTATGRSDSVPAEVVVLQRWLAAEHAVAYAYGVAGARLDGTDRRRATRGWTGHRTSRDRLTALVEARSGTPAGPAAAYALPVPVDGPAAARRLLVLVEERLAAVCADAVADLTQALRTAAADGLSSAAVSAARWRGRGETFPGLPERAS